MASLVTGEGEETRRPNAPPFFPTTLTHSHTLSQNKQNAGFVPDAVTLATGGTVRWATGPAERVRHGLVLAAGGVAVDAVMVEPGAVVPR